MADIEMQRRDLVYAAYQTAGATAPELVLMQVLLDIRDRLVTISLISSVDVKEEDAK